MAVARAADTDRLYVWNEERRVGLLERQRAGLMELRYDPQWLEGGFAISRSLPLTPEPFTAEQAVAHSFFANLLPEGRVREQIVRDLKIANSDFELLRAIGGECAGALTVLPVGQSPSGKRSYRELSPELLEELVRKRGHVFAGYAPDVRPRLSLAGAQDKLALLVRNGGYFLPEREAPSSHILKFEIEGYRHVPAYETFTTMLARRAGLPAVEIQLVEIGGELCSLTARYDRYPDARGDIVRLHQEDFCQALGYPHDKKYEDSGGPSFAECFLALREASTEPAIDGQHLLRWQVFNVLAGNSDGHAKNISLLHPAQGRTRLASFYDLVCTRAVERIDQRLAFEVGGERDPRRIRRAHWDRMAEACDVRKPYLRGLVEEAAASLPGSLVPAREEFEERFGPYPPLQRVEAVVRKQCRLALRD